MVRGSCLCGAVRYEADAPFKWMAHCHCSICRHCGSDVPYEIQDGKETMCIPAGSLDDDPGMRPQAHIFVRDKATCDVIYDSLPQFETRGKGSTSPIVDRVAPTLKSGVTQGSCLCGDIAYEFDGTPTRMTNCHCSRCRKSRGTAHATNVFVAQDKFRWTRGEAGLKTYKLPEAKFFNTCFCGNCGGVLPAFFEGAKIYLTPVGSIDTPLAAKPGVHIYVNNKAPWYAIHDTLPQFPDMPPREQMFALMFEPREA
jgi:hypothetical protein